MTQEIDKILDAETEKILKALMDNPEREFNKSELAEEAGISRDALYRRFDGFKELGIVTEEDNKYTLNEENDLTETLESIVNALKEYRN